MRFLISLIIISGFLGETYGQSERYDRWLEPGYFRGYNVVSDGQKELQDIIDFKNYGGNIIHIGTDGFMSEDSPYGIMQANIDRADQLVGYCRQTGVYYVMAVRSGPGAYDVFDESQGWTEESRIWNSGNLIEQRLYADMLKMIVQRYAGDTLFAGINLVVEPRPKVQFIRTNNSELYKFYLESIYNIHMNEVYQFLISEIREVNTELPIIIENFAYSTPELFPAYEVTDPYIIYDSHLYMPKEYTNALVPFSADYPGLYWNITYLSQMYYDADFMRETVLGKLKSFQDSINRPVLLGEFGMLVQQRGATEYIGDVLDIFKDYGWHFALWEWRATNRLWNIEGFQVLEIMGAWATVLSYFNPPPVPVLVFPENGSIVINPPVFRWERLTAYTSYDIDVLDGPRVMWSGRDLYYADWTYDGEPLREGETYTWRVRAKNPGGMPENESRWSGEWRFTLQNGSAQVIPSRFELYDNYPNPFNPKTVIRYQLAVNSFVSLKVYDILGREISTLVNQEMPRGNHSVEFDAADLPSGLYIYKLVTADFSGAKRMAVVK